MNTSFRFATMAFALAIASQPALAQDQNQLKFAHLFPLTHFLWTEAGEPYSAAIAETTEGQVDFQVYPAGQLGKDYVGALKNGLADMAIIVGSYASDKLPLTSVAELPVKYDSSCEATGKLWALAKPGGMLDQAEYAPAGLRPLFVAVVPTYKVLTTAKEIKTLEDVQGLKLRASGAAMEQAARALGAVPVQIQAPEVNDSLRRGTMDGAFWPYHSVTPYELETVVKYGVEGVSLGSTSVIFAMDARKWDALSDANKAVFEAEGLKVQASFCKWIDGDEERVRQLMIDEHGFGPTTLEGDELQRWQQALAPVVTTWAERMDGQGLSGSAALAAFQQATPEGVE